LLEGSVSVPRNTCLGAHLPGQQESGQSQMSGKRGGKLIGLPTNTNSNFTFNAKSTMLDIPVQNTKLKRKVKA